MNWKAFGLKYDKQETWAFEQMSYLLFCAELNNRIGLFRYKNQVGIETEPIEKGGKCIGFQAKYYDSSISKKKDEIIDSIRRTKSKNSQLNELFFYVNQEFSESSKRGKKKSKYQLEIEQAADEQAVLIEWRVPSHFELQLSLPENKYILDLFFSLEAGQGDLLDEVSKHNGNVLRAIQTEILFDHKRIKIDRRAVIDELKTAVQEKRNTIVSGEGGCGKTAILKEFYELNSKELPICIFKSSELNVGHINDVFQLDNKFTFRQFLDAYSDEPCKVFVIDSAEGLAEIIDNEVVKTLIHELKEHDWSIVFTSRYSYLNDLSFHIRENYQLAFDTIDISLISEDELLSISKKHEFSLPENQKFSERLRNLFYLSEYIRQHVNIDKQGNFSGFVELLWKKRIQNHIFQKDNVHLQRENCVLVITERRCETGRFYINGDDLPQQALFKLRQDEILGYDEAHNGYFITHDIYEEWALDKVVSRCFHNHSTTKQFFDELGSTLPMRRAFRLWLSKHLSENSEIIDRFVREAFTNEDVSRFWKDEILVSVLLSEYSEAFFAAFEQEIAANDYSALKRVLFLLRIACTDISEFQNAEKIKPKGRGWEEAIALTHRHKSIFFENNIGLVLPVLDDWCEFNREGQVTRLCGLLALGILEKTETEESFFFQDSVRDNVLKIICNAAVELQEELKVVFDKVVSHRWTRHGDPYQALCSEVLGRPYRALELIKVLPLNVIQLCDMFWQRPKPRQGFEYERDSMESRYGVVEKHGLDYFPSSAHQTPIRWLLQAAFFETLDFVVDFTDRAVETYSKSDYGREDVVEIKLHVGEKDVVQYLSGAIWCMYRGNGSPVVPNLLQSIHMALEKVLLEFAKAFDPKVVQEILSRILVQSKSASLTSVVCSVVLAYPDKFYDTAMILFRTIELFHVDTMRCMNEAQVKSLYSIGYGMDKLRDTLYADERMKTVEDEHRSSNLEALLFIYQFQGVRGFTESENAGFLDKLYKIIDGHRSNELVSEAYGALLARVDRRNLVAKVSNKDDDNYYIEFTPKELPDKVREESEEALNQYQSIARYSSLRVWSHLLLEERRNLYSEQHQEFDNNPQRALSETKQLVEELKGSEAYEIRIYDQSTPAFACSRLMIEHRDKLSYEDKAFCREIILSTLSILFAEHYGYQMGDGAEACSRAIPSLIDEYPEGLSEYIFLMIAILLDETALGHYKRICDYIIESIRISNFWKTHPEVAQSLLTGYIKIKLELNSIITERKKEEGYWGQPLRRSVLSDLKAKYINYNFDNYQLNISDVHLLDIRDLEILLQLIPSDTRDKVHLDIYEKSLPFIGSRLFQEQERHQSYNDHDYISLSSYKSVFRTIARFLLQRENGEIDRFLDTIVDSFSPSEETSTFLEELIHAEDELRKYDQFWHIWDSIYPKITQLCKDNRNRYLREILINYLLAWRWWNEGIQQWHSLRSENAHLYANASKDLGDFPSVLYSIVKVLNSVGTNFEEDGIDWIHTVVENNNSLDLMDLESSTLNRLEKFMRKYMFSNRERIRREIVLKNKVIPILDFMIERGSIHGYLLRESIL